MSRVYTYVKESGDLRGGDTRNIWSATQVNQVTGHDGLTDLYNSRKEYQQIFGSVENYISYMDQMYDLQESNPEVFKWWENEGMTLEQFADANGYPAPDGLDPLDQQELERSYMSYQANSAQQAYESMINSAEYQGLTEQYGLDTPVQNGDGDVFMFNGGFPVEISEVNDHMSATDYARIAAAVGLGAMAGPAISSVLGGGLTGGAASGMANSAISQVIMTGEIDPAGLAVGAVAGAFQGVADAAAAGESLSGIETAIDNAAWDLSGALGVDHNTANNILSAGAQGIVAGDSVGDIAANVVGQFGADVILANVDTGDLTTTVSNFFREGETEIPHDAIESILANGITAALGGNVGVEDVVMDYFEEGGSLGFLAPPALANGFDLPDLPSLDVPFDLGDVVYPAVNELVNVPDVDVPVDLNDLPTPDADLSDVEYADFNEIVNAPDVDIPTPDADLSDVEYADFNEIVNVPDVDIPTPDEDLSDVEYPDVNEWVDAPEIDSPDIDGPDLDLDLGGSGGMMRGGGGKARWEDYYTGDLGYTGIQRPNVIVRDAQNSGLLNDFIARNLGGRLFG